MTSRAGTESFLDRPPEALEAYLLEHARKDGAPAGARERALLCVASAAVGWGVVSGGALSQGSHASAVKATSWLIAKWLAAGLGAGLATITAAQGIQQLVTPSATVEPSRTVTTTAKQPLRQTRSPAHVLSAPEEASTLSPTLAVTSLGEVTKPAPSAPSARAASPASATSATSATSGALGRELSLLEQARAALERGRASTALQALADYRAEFPSGALHIEAAALTVEANARAGNGQQSERLAASFLEHFPNSPLAARVRGFATGGTARTPKP